MTPKSVKNPRSPPDAEHRAAAAELAAQMRAATAVQATTPHPEHCQLGGTTTARNQPRLRSPTSWGDSAWGCPAHVEEAILNVRNVFIANAEFGGLDAYLHRASPQ